MIHMTSKPYVEAAKLLVKLGYEPSDNPGSVIGKIFAKGSERLYLYSPLPESLAGYNFVASDGPGWRVDRDTETVYYPRTVADPKKAMKGAGRPWMPRDYSMRPMVYDIRDAAEHIGITEHAIRAAMYRAGHTNPLVATEKKTDRKIVLFNDADLHAWAEKRKTGSPRSRGYRTKGLLTTMSRDSLASLAKREIDKGDLDKEKVSALLVENGYSVADIEAASTDEVCEALRSVPRMSLVDLLVK